MLLVLDADTFYAVQCSVYCDVFCWFWTHTALGDSSYASFCQNGKSIDRRLKEIGGHCFFATGHADEAIG